MSLWAQFLNHSGRTIHKWTQYFPAYERHFNRFRNQSLLFLEIGCGQGGSLQMWKEYFGPYAEIVGLDIRPECAAFEESQIHVRIGDQSDPAFLQAIIDEFGVPDIVLDDGSHIMSHVVSSFHFLYPRISPTGVYMVEDLHTAYWNAYEGGLRRSGTFIELCKHLVDELNADWAGEALPATQFTRTTLSMHFYDSLAAFEKGRVPVKEALMIPPLGSARGSAT